MSLRVDNPRECIEPVALESQTPSDVEAEELHVAFLVLLYEVEYRRAPSLPASPESRRLRYWMEEASSLAWAEAPCTDHFQRTCSRMLCRSNSRTLLLQS
jgi:hypothetical protein